MKILFVFLTIFIVLTYSYKPVILLHGILTGPNTMEIIKARIEEVKEKLLMLNEIHTIVLFPNRNILEQSFTIWMVSKDGPVWTTCGIK